VTDARVVLVTAPDATAAERLVRTLVDERLVACGSIVPGVISIYHWQGELHRDHEVQILLKTKESRVAALLERVPALHPYEVPEVLVLPVAAGLGPYLDWVRRESEPAEAQ
jgi:periplasmic divalent cation tolerance protein